MVLAIISLITGLIISGVAIYYSVIGLTSIFAAAAIPIMVMGVALEVAKLVATVWLKQNWKTSPSLIKAYLVSAVAILMLITSMGIFGFLSKAHLDQNMVSGDVVDKVALIDEKIKTQKDNIETSRKALRQMDDSVDQVMSRSSDEKGADKAVQLRRSQAKERSRLQQEISTAQTEISKLQGERAPIATELRKVEAEVGPIKYIAAFIYGSAEQDILEKAVTWLIIIIVVVFDPLAVILLLASQYSFAQRSGKNNPEPVEEKEQTFISDRISSYIYNARQGFSDAINKIKGSIQTPVKQLPVETKAVEVAVVDEVVKEEPSLDSINLELAEVAEQDRQQVEYQIVDDADEETDTLPSAEEQRAMLAKFVEAVKEAEPVIPVPAPITGFSVPKVETAVPTQGIVPINVTLLKRDELDIPILENEETWSQRVIDESSSETPFGVSVTEWNKLLEVAEQEVEQETKKLQIIPELQKHIEERPSGLADFRYVQNEEQAESNLWQETRQQVEAEHIEHISQADYQEKVKEAIVKRLIKNLEEGLITIEEMSKDEAAAVERHLQKEIDDRKDNPNQST